MEISWLVKNIGDPQPYTLTTKEGGTAVYCTNVVRSLRWPGAITVCQNGRWFSMYIGNGVKATGVPFQPTAPMDVKEDPDDAEEHPEPNPKEAPPQKVETDTDANKPPTDVNDPNNS
jgi:radial spoke head protein 4A